MKQRTVIIMGSDSFAQTTLIKKALEEIDITVIDNECITSTEIKNYILQPVVTPLVEFDYQNERVGKGGRARNKSNFKKFRR